MNWWVPSTGNIIENRYMSANMSPNGSPEPSGGHFISDHSTPCAFAVPWVTTVPSGNRKRIVVWDSSGTTSIIEAVEVRESDNVALPSTLPGTLDELVIFTPGILRRDASTTSVIEMNFTVR